MKKFIVSSLLLTVALFGNLTADVSISFFANDTTGKYVDPNGSALNEGSLALVGRLDLDSYNALSAAQKLSFSEVSSTFSVISTDKDPFTASASGEYNINTGTVTNANGATSGDQLYSWVFDSSSGSTATAWGIFTSTNSLWQYPNDPGAAVVSISNGPMSSIFGSIESGSPDSFKLQAIPEPSAYATILGLLGLGYAVFCRRRRSSSQE